MTGAKEGSLRGEMGMFAPRHLLLCLHSALWILGLHQCTSVILKDERQLEIYHKTTGDVCVEQENGQQFIHNELYDILMYHS